MGSVLINPEREAETVLTKVSTTTTTGSILTNAGNFQKITVLAKSQFLQFSGDPCPVVHPAKRVKKDTTSFAATGCSSFLIAGKEMDASAYKRDTVKTAWS
jgi:hypothetical protein